jgi:hypothetical protein
VNVAAESLIGLLNAHIPLPIKLLADSCRRMLKSGLLCHCSDSRISCHCYRSRISWNNTRTDARADPGI